eukprot:m51a1_g1894 hypothetical protein (1696) ;mRNA; f:745779-755517
MMAHRPSLASAALCSALLLPLLPWALGTRVPATTVALDGLPASQGFSVVASSPQALWGSLPSRSADLDGDGVDDVAVGGDRAALVFGRRTRSTFTSSTSLSLLSLHGQPPPVGSGVVVVDAQPLVARAVLDVDGDGAADVVLGAADGATAGRRLAVLRGRPSTSPWPAAVDLARGLDGTDGFLLLAPDGAALAGPADAVGDVNGDGHGDLAVSVAPDKVYVVYGRADGDAWGPAFVLGSGGASRGFVVASGGPALVASALGDVNGDGVADFAVAVPEELRVFVFFGRPGGPATQLRSLEAFGPSDGFVVAGLRSAVGADVNGDGASDVVGGYAGPSPLDREAECVAVLLGHAERGYEWPDVDASTGGLFLCGPASSGFGAAGLAAADLNGDAVDDVLVGAPRESNGDGHVYVFWGREAPDLWPGVVDTMTWDRSAGFGLAGRNGSAGALGADLGALDANGDAVADLAASGRPGGPLPAELVVLYGVAAPVVTHSRVFIDEGESLTLGAPAVVVETSDSPEAVALAASTWAVSLHVLPDLEAPATEFSLAELRAGRVVLRSGGSESPLWILRPLSARGGPGRASEGSVIYGRPRVAQQLAGRPDCCFAAAGRPYSFRVPTETFAHSLSKTVNISVDIRRLPRWLRWDREALVLSGTPRARDVGSVVVHVAGTDENGASAECSFELRVHRPPDVRRPLAQQRGCCEAVAGRPYAFAVAGDTFASAEGVAVALSAQNVPSWLHFDSATGAFAGTPTAAAIGAAGGDVTVTATDANGLSSTSAFHVAVRGAPQVVAELAGQRGCCAAVLRRPYAFAPAPPTFAHPESAPMTYTATLVDGSPLPAWLTFSVSGSAIAFSGTAQAPGLLAVRVAAADARGHVAHSDFELRSVNSPPEVVRALADRSAVAGQRVAFEVPAGTFADPNGDALTYSAALSTGAPLRVVGAAVEGLAPSPGGGSVGVTVTATDPYGATAACEFRLALANSPPEVRAPIGGQLRCCATAAGSEYSFVLAEGTFADPNGDPLALSASLQGGAPLPQWLAFDGARRLFSGTAPGAGALLHVTVTATDAAGAAARDTFALAVVAPEAPGAAVARGVSGAPDECPAARAAVDAHSVVDPPTLSVSTDGNNVGISLVLPQTSPARTNYSARFVDPASGAQTEVLLPAVERRCAVDFSATVALSSLVAGARPEVSESPTEFVFSFAVLVSWQEVFSVGAFSMPRSAQSRLRFDVVALRSVAAGTAVVQADPPLLRAHFERGSVGHVRGPGGELQYVELSLVLVTVAALPNYVLWPASLVASKSAGSVRLVANPVQLSALDAVQKWAVTVLLDRTELCATSSLDQLVLSYLMVSSDPGAQPHTGTIVGDLGKLESWCPSGSKLSVAASQSLFAGPGASDVSVVRAQRGATVYVRAALAARAGRQWRASLLSVELGGPAFKTGFVVASAEGGAQPVDEAWGYGADSCVGDATVCYHFVVPEGVALETPVLMVRSEILVQSTDEADEADKADEPHKTSSIVTAQTPVLVVDGRMAGSRDQRAEARGDQKERVEEQAVQVERRGLAADAAIAAVFALACVGAIAAVVVAIRKRERKVNAAAARRDPRRRPSRRDLEMKRDSPRGVALETPVLMVRSEILVKSTDEADKADKADEPHKTSSIVTAQTPMLVVDGRAAGSRDQRAEARGDQKERVEEQAVQWVSVVRP